jgi:hypothetical protein
LAASPVVKTVFMRSSIPCWPAASRTSQVAKAILRESPGTGIIPDLPLAHPIYGGTATAPSDGNRAVLTWGVLDSSSATTKVAETRRIGITNLSTDRDYS